MSLANELGMKRPFELPGHEALLSIYYTASILKKRADEFFRPFGVTDVQYNVITLLIYHADDSGGLSQASLSDMMLVNRANITSLIDRMEKAGLVIRTAAEDRRFKIVKATEKAKQLMSVIEPLYRQQVQELMGHLSDTQQSQLINITEAIRKELRK